MFNYEIINNSKSINIDNNILKNIFLKIDENIENKQNWIVNIIFVWEEEIKQLNNDYRWKDYVTDVLSFHYYTDYSLLKDEDIRWEIILCEEKILSQSIEYNLTNEQEFYKLVIHSILHLLWYDHENDKDYLIMKQKEDLIWNLIFN